MTRIERNKENESWSTTWLDPETVVNPYSNPKIRSNSNVRIQGIIENESCSTTWVDPKTIFEPHIAPKYSLLGSQNEKKTPNLSQNQITELLHYKSIPCNILNLISTLKMTYFGTKKTKKKKKLDKIKSKNWRTHVKHMLLCYMIRPKTYLEP